MASEVILVKYVIVFLSPKNIVPDNKLYRLTAKASDSTPIIEMDPVTIPVST